MKIRHLFRSWGACKAPVRQPTRAKARPVPLGLEALEDRMVPAAVPTFPFSTSTLIAASLNAGAAGSQNGNASISPLANSAVFALGALSGNLAQEATFLASMVASTVPGGSVPAIVGGNPALIQGFAFDLLLAELNGFGGLGGDVATSLNSTFGAGMNFSTGNS